MTARTITTSTYYGPVKAHIPAETGPNGTRYLTVTAYYDHGDTHTGFSTSVSITQRGSSTYVAPTKGTAPLPAYMFEQRFLSAADAAAAIGTALIDADRYQRMRSLRDIAVANGSSLMEATSKAWSVINAIDSGR